MFDAAATIRAPRARTPLAAYAALLGLAQRIAGAILIVLGLFTRFAALALLGLVAVIQLFVFPGNWAEHLLWASLLLLFLARGAGTVSLDHLASQFLFRTI